jgi:hypothetical protein
VEEEPGPRDLQRARKQGAKAAEHVLDGAPDHPLLRVAWAAGLGHPDQLRAAVQDARSRGFTWKQIGEATDEHWRTAQSKYGPGYPAHARYRERKRAAAAGDS